MNTLIRTEEFDAWMRALRDPQGEARILLRLRSASKGNFGDCKPVGEGISEMRINAGPGYRIYFTRRGEIVYLLLLAGDKSTQVRDIKHAKAILKTLSKE